MNNIESYLNPEVLKSLYSHQIQKLNLETKNFIKTNTELDFVSFEYCPKCNTYQLNIIKGGKSNTGKQMYRCKHCHKRFVFDHGNITFQSQQDPSSGIQLIVDTLNGVSMKSTAAKIDVTERTVFSMRHKFFTLLEEWELHIQTR